MSRLMTAVLLTLQPWNSAVALSDDDAACAQVTIQIEQKAVMTRTAFHATLGLDNQSGSVLEDVLVVIEITDALGQPANHLFGIPTPELSGILDVAGTGDVVPGMKATAQWDILAAPDAVPGPDPVEYRIGGLLSYSQAGTFVDIDLLPVAVQVFPSPTLGLEYYLQREVYGDNPFTPYTVEDGEQFTLGLVVRNTGYGAAENLSFESNQPTLVDNESGLLLDMQIVAAELNGQPVESNLLVEIGDLPGGENAVARWKLESSLKGEFIDVTATLTHDNAIDGGPDLSFIDENISATHLLEHVALVDAPGPGDGLPDFLIIDDSLPYHADVLTGDPLPNQLRLSEGGSLPVTTRRDHAPLPQDEDVNVVKVPSSLDTMGQVLVAVDQPGWQHVRFDSLDGPGFELVQVVRTGPSGGRLSIAVGGPADVVNAWVTDRCEAPAGSSIPSLNQRLTNILDHAPMVGTYTYDLTYVPSPIDKLTTDVDAVSVFMGGTQTLAMDFGQDLAGASFLLLGSTQTAMSAVGSVTIPLEIDDPYFDTVFALAGPLGLSGVLDGFGRAELTLTLPPDLAPFVLLGSTLHHAAVAYQPGGALLDATNSAPLYFVP